MHTCSVMEEGVAGVFSVPSSSLWPCWILVQNFTNSRRIGQFSHALNLGGNLGVVEILSNTVVFVELKRKAGLTLDSGLHRILTYTFHLIPSDEGCSGWFSAFLLQVKVFEEERRLTRTPVKEETFPRNRKLPKLRRKRPWMHLHTTEVLCNLASLIFRLAFCLFLFVLKPILLAFEAKQVFYTIYLICIFNYCLSVTYIGMHIFLAV